MARIVKRMKKDGTCSYCIRVSNGYDRQGRQVLVNRTFTPSPGLNGKKLEKELQRLKSKLASAQGDDLADQAVEVQGLKLLVARLDGADIAALRETMDKLKDRLRAAAIVLASVVDGKVTLIAGVTSAESKRLKAGELVNHVAQQIGGKGGGRPDMAQAGGTQPENLPAALASVKAWVEGKLAG